MWWGSSAFHSNPFGRWRSAFRKLNFTLAVFFLRSPFLCASLSFFHRRCCADAWLHGDSQNGLTLVDTMHADGWMMIVCACAGAPFHECPLRIFSLEASVQTFGDNKKVNKKTLARVVSRLAAGICSRTYSHRASWMCIPIRIYIFYPSENAIISYWRVNREWRNDEEEEDDAAGKGGEMVVNWQCHILLYRFIDIVCAVLCCTLYSRSAPLWNIMATHCMIFVVRVYAYIHPNKENKRWIQ